jgi:hypothetical protein
MSAPSRTVGRNQRWEHRSPTRIASFRTSGASAVAENRLVRGEFRCRRRTQGALAPRPATTVIVWSGITVTASPIDLPGPPHLQTIGRWGADSCHGPHPCRSDRAGKSRPQHATVSTTRHSSRAKPAVCAMKPLTLRTRRPRREAQQAGATVKGVFTHSSASPTERDSQDDRDIYLVSMPLRRKEIADSRLGSPQNISRQLRSSHALIGWYEHHAFDRPNINGYSPFRGNSCLVRRGSRLSFG